MSGEASRLRDARATTRDARVAFIGELGLTHSSASVAARALPYFTGMPMTFVTDSCGRLTYTFVGSLDEQARRSVLDCVLAGSGA